VPLGCYTHLLARNADPVVSQVELEADRLACELLAPVDSVLADGIANCDALVERLCADYGLPRRPAEQYASWLLRSPPMRTWRDRLRFGFSVAERSLPGNDLEAGWMSADDPAWPHTPAAVNSAAGSG
jgi:hypothetical protein